MAKGWGGPQSFQYAMTQCCAVAVSLFGGYFLAAYLINGLRVRMFAMDNDIPLCNSLPKLCVGSVFHAENHNRHIARFQYNSPVASIFILYMWCGKEVLF